MSGPTQLSATAAIATALALIEQFISSLSSDKQHHLQPESTDTPSPLLLSSAAAKSLKAQVTKLSLLTVTTPFTPTAISTCLQSVNDSVLPSLVTATFLTTAELYTSSFENESKSLTRGVLRDLQALIKLVEARSKDGKPTAELPELKKKEIAEATGRVWEDCDDTVKFAAEGLPGFVVRRSKQWLDLMKDAVKELQEWDPDEEINDEDLFGDVGSDDNNEDDANTNGDIQKKEDQDRATISAGAKDQALKVLSRIPQSVHVVVKQRLEKLKKDDHLALPSATRAQLDQILVKTRNVSELMDESAEGIYLGNLELCLKKAGEARAVTIEIVEGALDSFDQGPGKAAASEETQEDKYLRRALDWVRQVDMVKDLPRR